MFFFVHYLTRQDTMRFFLTAPLVVSFLVACQTSKPTAPQEDAAKAMTQQLPCEATFLDTTLKAAISRNGEIIPLYWSNGRFYEPDGYSVSLTDEYKKIVAVLYAVASLEWTALRTFNDPFCNPNLEAVISQEIRSTKNRIEQYACAIGQIENLIDQRWLDPDCDADCWNALKGRKDRAYERYEYYQEELEPIERMYAAFFSSCD